MYDIMGCMNFKENPLLLIIDFILKPFTNTFLQRIKTNKPVVETINLYKDKKFIPIRFWDAPFIEVERLVPESGFVIDLGCGEGVFTNFLGISSSARKVLGIEIDKRRIKFADRGIKNVSFEWGDATRVELPNAGTIILFHVLHHLLSRADQENIINRCVEKLNKDGKLIIVEVEPKFNLTYLLTWLTDHFIVPWLFEKRLYSPILFRNVKDWKEVIKRNNLSCKVINAQKGHPFTHIILECQKN